MSYMHESIAICISKITQQHPLIKQIFDEIYQQGGRVLLVGGAVRDCLLGSSNFDVDFEVYHLSFQELEAILKKFGMVSFVGKSFGVLKLHGLNADWSIPRCDSAGRKPCVSLDPNMNFLQAFKRRDVTVNAMGIDVASLELVDPLDGFSDLQKKILRSADPSFFIQDPLRLFRVMQFIARFDMTVDAELSAVCQTMDISDVASARIEQEIEKMFVLGSFPSKSFLWLAKINRFSEIFSDVVFNQQFLHRADAIAQHSSLKDEEKKIAAFALLVCNLQELYNQQIEFDKMADSVHERLHNFLKKFTPSKELIDRALNIGFYVRYIPYMVEQSSFVEYKWLAFLLDPWCSLEFLSEIGSCWYSGELIEQFIKQAKQAKVLHHAEKPLITGKDLLSVAQGKEIGRLAAQAYHMQINESIVDKQKLLKKIVSDKK